MPLKVLIVDDDADLCKKLSRDLQGRGYACVDVSTTKSAKEMFRKDPPAVAIIASCLAGGDPIELCSWVRDNCPGVSCIVAAEEEDLEIAVRAIRAGAYDLVPRPFSLDKLCLAIERARERQSLREEVKRLRRERDEPGGIHGLIGESRPMKKLFHLIRQVADTDATVLIAGESGTGKELVARAIHELSSRADQSFVAINCAAVSPTLLESELFGHVQGAFTGARTDHAGVFVQASGGTLFLDELAEMPLEMQAKLLRVLQENQVRPVGGDRDLPFDTRILAATNRDLDTEVEKKRFREDLFYRINVVGIELPPLRSRGKDVLELAQYFLQHQAHAIGKEVRGLSAAAAKKLLAYDWPGNVRELENAIEHAVTLTSLDTLVPDDLPDRIVEYQSTRLIVETSDPQQMPSLEEMERRYIRRVLEAARGNKTHAARILGINRRSMYRKMKRLGMDRET